MRYARESRPGGQDDDLPDTRRDGLGEVLVEEVRADRLVVAHVPEDRGDLGVDGGGLLDDRLVEHRRPRTGARALDEDRGVRVADERVVACGLGGTRRRHHDGGRADTAGDVPGVVVGAQRAHRVSSASSAFNNTLEAISSAS